MKRLFLAALLAAPVYAQPPSGLAPVSSFDRITDKEKRAIALFQEAGRVIMHPRCLNCHPRDDTPRQGELKQNNDCTRCETCATYN